MGEINPVLVGLLGVIAGAIIVFILHFAIVTWCKNSTTSPDPEQNATIPVSQSQNRARARANNVQLETSSSTSTSTSNSMVQLIVLSRCVVAFPPELPALSCGRYEGSSATAFNGVVVRNLGEKFITYSPRVQNKCLGLLFGIPEGNL
ncbi:hypothetical protein HAX54_047958 [Datura stramonium]|uniref:Uncharacterized protein n=1 Tax=Datura stramonium TaxID=4076 RepID=A0ABS8WKN6_DATST|nr:hypothetical protein [Datura stramonium]